MFIEPEELRTELARLEEIEKASLRLVVQAIYDYRETAVDIFQEENDLVADIGEDITREALDKLGMSRIDQRLFGKVDYKRARCIFHPEYTVKQASFVDSKAEKISDQGAATLQTSQFSMKVRQVRGGQAIEVPGEMPPILRVRDENYIITTLFVKYNYDEENDANVLKSITATAVPNGFLQAKYNPTAQDTIWLAGRNSPLRGEMFRVRLSFRCLKNKAGWRVQKLFPPPQEFLWGE